MMARTSANHGFTLPEIMITLGIVGILASIAWPSYIHVLHRVRRTEAQTGLLALQHAQERYYLTHLRYAVELAGGTGLGMPASSQSGDYHFSVEASADGQRYIASATAHAGGRQHHDRQCRILRIDELGQQAAEDAAGRSSTARCWP